MLMWILGVFFVLHGVVHLLYAGHSRKLFELQPGLAWPEGSWALSRLFGDARLRMVVSAACVLAALGFAAAAVGIITQQTWWRPMVVGVSIFSAVFYTLAWDGKLKGLDDSGGVGVLINLAILIAVLVLQWPNFDF